MIETLDEGTTTATDNQETLEVGRCECNTCGSVIPPLSIFVTPTDGFGLSGIARRRRVEVLCEHCDSAFVASQVREDGEWVTKSSHQADARDRERIARAIAGQHSATVYVDRPEPDPAEQATEEVIEKLEELIAKYEQLLAEARGRRSELMGVTRAEAAALTIGKPGGGSFPFVSGDVRHLMRAHDGDEQADWDIWDQR